MAQKRDPSMLDGITSADRQRLIELSVEDPSKRTTTGSLQLSSVNGRAPSAVERAAFDARVADLGPEMPSSAEISEALSSPSLSAAATKCFTYTKSVQSKNVFGAGLWEHWIETRYCHNGSALSSHEVSSWGKTYWVGWTWEGTTTKEKALSSHKNLGWSYVQNHFRYAVFQVGTIQDTYPSCLRAQVSTNASANKWGTNCGLYG